MKQLDQIEKIFDDIYIFFEKYWKYWIWVLLGVIGFTVYVLFFK